MRPLKWRWARSRVGSRRSGLVDQIMDYLQIVSYLRPQNQSGLQRLMTANAQNPAILIADDQEDVREALRFLLKGEGYSCHTVGTPKAAFEAVTNGDFDLAIIDLNYSRDTTSGWEIGVTQRFFRTSSEGVVSCLLGDWVRSGNLDV